MQLTNKVLETDVLIVGYGPVGAALGCLLGRYNIRTAIIDREEEVLEHPRAIALDNEALRVLQMVGLPEDAFEKVIIPQVKMRCPMLREFASINTTGSKDGHPKLVTFFQPELEKALRDQVRKCASVEALVSTELRSFKQHLDHVEAKLRTQDGTSITVHCRYLIGADGAKSMVRDAAGLKFSGKSYAEDWLIIDALNVPTPIDHVEFLCDHRRPAPHMVAPGGRQRWEFMLHPGEDPETMLREESIAKLLEPWGTLDQITIERKAIYRFHSCVAKKFSRGRVFLVGDAAHITPPFVGQGLVAGLRDVANLGWKLAWVLQGNLSHSLLNSYSQERRPHAKAMINLARLMGSLIMPSNAATSILVHGSMRIGRMLPPARRLIEELDIKPANRFKNGFFMPAVKSCGIVSGGQLPQSLVRKRDGEIFLSDELFNNGFSLVGLGVDPASALSRSERVKLEQQGVAVFQIQPRGKSEVNGSFFLEDVADAFVTRQTWGQVALVRPDCVVMNIGDIKSISAMLKKTNALLEKVRSTANEKAFA